MRNAVTLLLFVILVPQVVPAAGAVWRVQGSFEPDTLYDENGPMWTGPPTVDDMVYFNALARLADASPSPNVGLVGSRIYPGGVQSWTAYLGIWRDCNRDGYLGLAETGALEYRTTLARDNACRGSQNDNGWWIREFQWIGPADVVGDQDLDGDVQDDIQAYAPFVRNQRQALVWGDHGVPGAPDELCPVQPSRGATASTGALIGFTDCHLNRRVAAYVAFAEAESVGSIGLAFEDPQSPQTSDSPLNQDPPFSLWGDPHEGSGEGTYSGGLIEDGARAGGASEDPAFTVWDCSNPMVVNDPLDRGLRIQTGRPAPSPNDATTLIARGGSRSYYDALNDSYDATVDGCDASDSDAIVPFDPESGAAQNDARRSNDIRFRFEIGTDLPATPNGLPAWGDGAPRDLGIGATRATTGPAWIGTVQGIAHAQLVRADAQPSGAQYATFYASVGDMWATFPPLKGAAGRYGADACNGAGSGIHGGFECDPNAWWRDDNGDAAMPRQRYGPQGRPTPDSPWGPSRPIGARVWQPYQLRDVDCYDGSASDGQPAYASLQYFTDDASCASTRSGALSPAWKLVPELDEDFNGIGDTFQSKYRLSKQQIEDALAMATDWDADGAGVIEEFKWATIPLALPGTTIEKARDHDGDKWLDGDEIHYWNANSDPLVEGRALGQSSGGVAYRDEDSHEDTNENGVANQHDPDSDSDGALDGDEVNVYGTYPEFADSDCAAGVWCPAPSETRFRDPARGAGPGDLIDDRAEYEYWSARPETGGPLGDACDDDGLPNIRDADSDGDGLVDGEEISSFSDPCNGDGDGDGLSDGEEKTILTNASDPDTDADGRPDGWEHAHRPATDPRDGTDGSRDLDRDRLTNADEWQHETDPNVADTDKDTLLDGDEVGRGTDPVRWDSDGDGMPDGWEVTMKLDPRSPHDANEDADGDVYVDPDTGALGIHTNRDEYEYLRPPGYDEEGDGIYTGGTNATNADTDGDGIQDGPEIYGGSDPRSPVPGVNADRDNDGLTPEQELAFGTRPGDSDSDDDGLCDGGRKLSCLDALGLGTAGAPGEVIDYGSNARSTDSDGDGMTDLAESLAFDPTRSGKTPDPDADGAPAIIDPDADGDGLTDGDEQRAIEEGGYGTNALLADTDGDTLTDHDELFVYTANGRASDPRSLDTDNDRLDDGQELLTHFTWPDSSDTDGDGVSDGDEVARGTSPLVDDTERDGMPDGWELRYGLDPLVDDASEDKDRDSVAFGLTNLEEYLLDTDPTATDTDQDGINDQLEVLLVLDPREASDAESDDDADGLTNLMEATLGTLPNVADTDGDLVNDGDEACTNDLTLLAAKLTCTDPLRRDTDADGLDDDRERKLWNTISASAWRTPYDSEGLGLVPNADNNLRDADSDNDGLDDGQEWLVFRNDPTRSDTDGDGESDAYELLVGSTDPRDAASFGGPHERDPRTDADLDGLTNAEETTIYHTDPNNADTDDDGIPDGTERMLWGSEWNQDIDADSVGNLLDDDSDGDTLADGVEYITAPLSRSIFMIGDPRAADTDKDGLLDGEEATNNLRQPSAAQAEPLPASQPASAPWSGADANGYYVTGLFGLRLYAAEDPGDAMPSVGRANANSNPNRRASTYDFADSDEDLLHDGAERQRGCNPNGSDTDQDGIPDSKEPAGDVDQDGKPNCDDTDSDNDLLLDGDEDRNKDGQRTDSETSAYDADTDNDALCDNEESPSNKKTNPLNPDTDGDGASDGLEWLRRSGCAAGGTQSGVPLIATTASGPVNTGRSTYQPYTGNQAESSVGLTPRGVAPAMDSDSDADGILDGIEDWNANGVWDMLAGETKPGIDDTDGDRLMDGLELLINAPAKGSVISMTFADFVSYNGRTLAQAAAAAKYDPLDWRKTDPTKADTDGDDITDGQDINPNGLAPAVVEIALKSLSIFDPVDSWAHFGENRCSPEPYFKISIGTAAGTVDLNTPNLNIEPPIRCNGEAELGSYLTSEFLKATKKTNDLKDRATGADGLIRFNLIENIAKYDRSTTPTGDAILKDQIIVKITMGDTDHYCEPNDSDCDIFAGQDESSDIIDISDRRNQESLMLPITLGATGVVDKKPQAARTPVNATGREGGSWWSDGTSEGDDGGLDVEVVDKVRKVFLDNALWLQQRTQTREPAPPPGGQLWGD